MTPSPEPPLIAHWAQIEPVLERVDLLAQLEAAFVSAARGHFVLPPVGEMLFEDPPGEMHLKTGYPRDGELAVVKVASGFPGNAELGLSPSQGLMLLFDRCSGAVRAVLLDEGRLTDVRTAAAGAVVARALAPQKVQAIGLLGTGIQARLQMQWLAKVQPCRELRVWGRHEGRLARVVADLKDMGFQARAAPSPEQLARDCDLIVTATASLEPLLRGEWLRPGAHITAVGSDGAGKQELHSSVLQRADLVIVDRLAQCRERGELAAALRAGVLREEDAIELGTWLGGEAGRRREPHMISVADLTGVAVQDHAIAQAVWRGLVAERVDR